VKPSRAKTFERAFPLHPPPHIHRPEVASSEGSLGVETGARGKMMEGTGSLPVDGAVEGASPTTVLATELSSGGSGKARKARCVLCQGCDDGRRVQGLGGPDG
jgi:hypothetical protein